MGLDFKGLDCRLCRPLQYVWHLAGLRAKDLGIRIWGLQGLGFRIEGFCFSEDFSILRQGICNSLMMRLPAESARWLLRSERVGCFSVGVALLADFARAHAASGSGPRSLQATFVELILVVARGHDVPCRVGRLHVPAKRGWNSAPKTYRGLFCSGGFRV